MTRLSPYRFNPKEFTSSLLSVFAITIVFVPCGWTEVGVTKSEILIGSCAPLQTDIGLSEVHGAQAYIDYINHEKGGVNGRKIRLIAIDDNYNAEGAKKCFDQLVHQGVLANTAFAGAANSVTYVKYSMEYQIPVIGIASGAKFLFEPTKRYVFSVRATYVDEAMNLVGAMHDHFGFTKFAVLYENGALGFEGLAGYKDALAKFGSKSLAEASFLTTQKEFGKQLETVRAANPEGVLIMANYKSAAQLLKDAQKVGWKPRFGLLTARDAIISEAGEKASQGLLMASQFPQPSQMDLPTMPLFHQIMEKYQPRDAADFKRLEGFVHGMILVEAIRRAGSNPTRAKLIDVLEHMHDWDIGLGSGFRVTFSPKNHQGFNHVELSVVDHGVLRVISDWKKLAN